MSNQDKENGVNKSVINWYPGHMAKAKRELKENIDLIDVVYEVIDARMPISSKVIDSQGLFKNKPRILIVTKYDMCDKKVTDEILSRYKDCDIVKFNLLKDNVKVLIDKTKIISKSINDIRAKKGLKPRKIRVVVVGAPNVGKSTLINKLVGRKAVQTGNNPGVTKSLGWIRINNDIELLDSPGILLPKMENQDVAYTLAAFSSIKEEIVDKEHLAYFIVNKLIELYQNNLKERYKLDIINKDSIFEDISKSRGLLSKGGVCDLDKVYLTLIKDFKDGCIGNITLDR